MLLQDTDQKKLKKVDSTAWQNYAVEKLVVLENVVQDVVQHKDRLGLPNQLLEVANDALKSSSDISVTILQLCKSFRINTNPFSH